MSVTYKIGEAAGLLNLKTYVLRFWETEFPQIAPLRTEKGQRLYTDEHIALLRRIRHLLHERGLTIEGARRVLAEEASGRGPGNGFARQGQTSSLPLFGAHDREDGPGDGLGDDPGDDPGDGPGGGSGDGSGHGGLPPARPSTEQSSTAQSSPEGFKAGSVATEGGAALSAALREKEQANTRLRGLLAEVEKELTDIAENLRRSS